MIEKRSIQLIEFGGIPGAGKSTIFKQVNEYLFKRLHYFPGPNAEWINILEDLPVRKSEINIPFKLANFLRFFKKEKRWLNNILERNGLWEKSVQDFPGFMEFLLSSNQTTIVDEERIQDRTAVTQYLMKLIQYYCYILNYTNRDFLMFSEGFYRHLKIFVLMAEEKSRFNLKQALELCPPVSLFIYLDVDPQTAYQRIVNRFDGPPSQFKNYSQEQLMGLLKRAYQSDLEYLSLLESNGVKVVRIESNKDDIKVLTEVLFGVRCLFNFDT